MIDYASKSFPRRINILTTIRLAYLDWQIGMSDAHLNRMYGEEEQVRDDIQAELKTKLEYADAARKLRGGL